MYKLRVSMLTLAVLGLAASAALAQRGAGDPAGVARSGNTPEIVTLSGKVLEVQTEPCTNTTGRSPLGTHFLMKTAEGKTLNIHLGPAGVHGLHVGHDDVVGPARLQRAYGLEALALDEGRPRFKPVGSARDRFFGHLQGAGEIDEVESQLKYRFHAAILLRGAGNVSTGRDLSARP